MGGWRPLPEDLPPDLRRLVEQLRLLKGRTGLSLMALSGRTACSKSAWQRYLNGTKLPPRSAVEALGRVAGADAARLVALWALAERAWLARESESSLMTVHQPLHTARDLEYAPPALPSAAPPAAPSAAPPPDPARRPLPRGLATALSLAAVAAAVGAGAWLAVGPPGLAGRVAGQRDASHASAAASPTGRQPAGRSLSVDQQMRGAPDPVVPICTGPACQGLNPQAAGCEHGARTVGSVRVEGIDLALRYSSRCGTAWAQAEGGRGRGTRLRETSVASPDGTVLAAPAAGLSPMLSSGDPAGLEACVLVGDVEACAGTADRGGEPERLTYLPPG